MFYGEDLGEIVGGDDTSMTFAYVGDWVPCIGWFARTVRHATRDRKAQTVGVVLEVIPRGDANYRFVCTVVRNPDPEAIARCLGAVIDLGDPEWRIMLRVRAIGDALGHVRPVMARGFVPVGDQRPESN